MEQINGIAPGVGIPIPSETPGGHESWGNLAPELWDRIINYMDLTYQLIMRTMNERMYNLVTPKIFPQQLRTLRFECFTLGTHSRALRELDLLCAMFEPRDDSRFQVLEHHVKDIRIIAFDDAEFACRCEVSMFRWRRVGSCGSRHNHLSSTRLIMGALSNWTRLEILELPGFCIRDIDELLDTLQIYKDDTQNLIMLSVNIEDVEKHDCYPGRANQNPICKSHIPSTHDIDLLSVTAYELSTLDTFLSAFPSVARLEFRYRGAISGDYSEIREKDLQLDVPLDVPDAEMLQRNSCLVAPIPTCLVSVRKSLKELHIFCEDTFEVETLPLEYMQIARNFPLLQRLTLGQWLFEPDITPDQLYDAILCGKNLRHLDWALVGPTGLCVNASELLNVVEVLRQCFALRQQRLPGQALEVFNFDLKLPRNSIAIHAEAQETIATKVEDFRSLLTSYGTKHQIFFEPETIAIGPAKPYVWKAIVADKFDQEPGAIPSEIRYETQQTTSRELGFQPNEDLPDVEDGELLYEEDEGFLPEADEDDFEDIEICFIPDPDLSDSDMT